jgi:hypothetical protein
MTQPTKQKGAHTMSAEFVNTASGILTVRITGKLTCPELRAAQKGATEIVQQQSKMRILVLAGDFQGWERGGDWGDLSFQTENDPNIAKMAVVGERKWEDLALVFAGKGFRQFPVEYFQPADLTKARAWLAQTNEQFMIRWKTAFTPLWELPVGGIYSVPLRGGSPVATAAPVTTVPDSPRQPGARRRFQGAGTGGRVARPRILCPHSGSDADTKRAPGQHRSPARIRPVRPRRWPLEINK